MYETSRDALVEERIQNGEILKNLSEEKRKLEAKHTTLLADVEHFILDTEKRVHKHNYKRILDECEDQTKEALAKAVEEKNLLLEEKQKWEEENKQLKEEKIRLEQTLLDLLKSTDAHKEKMRKIKDLCDEWCACVAHIWKLSVVYFNVAFCLFF